MHEKHTLFPINLISDFSPDFSSFAFFSLHKDLLIQILHVYRENTKDLLRTKQRKDSRSHQALWTCPFKFLFCHTSKSQVLVISHIKTCYSLNCNILELSRQKLHFFLCLEQSDLDQVGILKHNIILSNNSAIEKNFIIWAGWGLKQSTSLSFSSSLFS